MQQLLGQVAGFALLLFPLQLVDQIDCVVETQAFALVDGGDALNRMRPAKSPSELQH